MKKFVAAGLALIGLALAFVVPGWLADHPDVTLALLIAGVLVFVGLALAAGVAIGGYWTRSTMQAGAQIALTAQNINDTWDAKKTAAMAGLVREGATIGRQMSGGNTLPALPMPGQEVWLPALNEFKVDIEDGERG